MDNSPLNRLPPELRNKIYEFVLRQRRPIHLVFLPRWRSPGSGPTHYQARARPPLYDQHALAITRTCRQLHGETKGMVYTLNDFRFPFSLLPGIFAPETAVVSFRNVDGLRQWLERLPSATLPEIGEIELDAGMLRCVPTSGPAAHSFKPYAITIARAIREVRNNLTVLPRNGSSASVRLTVKCLFGPHGHHASATLVLPLHDLDALRTLATVSGRPEVVPAPLVRTNGMIPLVQSWKAQRHASRGCREVTDAIIEALLEALK